MTRIIAHYVPLETAALGLVELVLSFLIVEAFLNAPGSLAALGTQVTASPGSLTALAAIFALITATIGTSTGLYRPEACLERRCLLISAATAGLLAFPVLLAVGGGFHISLTSTTVGRLLVLLLLWQAGIVLTHAAFAAMIRPNGTARRVLVLGPDRCRARLVSLLRSRRAACFEPIPAADVPALSPAALRQQRLWGIVVADPTDTSAGTATLLDNKLRGVPVLSAAAFCERHLGRIDLETAEASWLLAADGFAPGRLSAAAKRSLDIAISLSLLIMTAPVMLITALLIRLDNPGPVLYRQARVGLSGTPFTLLKFRSMRVDAEAGGAPRWAQQRDPRTTRVGRFIRMTRIDELPQLVNVLRGEMSIIGPRPERPHFVAQLDQVIPLYRQRSFVKPGITGWAQVNYPYGASVEDAREKLAYDLYYVKNRGLMLDLLILFATVRVILFREGAR